MLFEGFVSLLFWDCCLSVVCYGVFTLILLFGCCGWVYYCLLVVSMFVCVCSGLSGIGLFGLFDLSVFMVC